MKCKIALVTILIASLAGLSSFTEAAKAGNGITLPYSASMTTAQKTAFDTKVLDWGDVGFTAAEESGLYRAAAGGSAELGMAELGASIGTVGVVSAAGGAIAALTFGYAIGTGLRQLYLKATGEKVNSTTYPGVSALNLSWHVGSGTSCTAYGLTSPCWALQDSGATGQFSKSPGDIYNAAAASLGGIQVTGAPLCGSTNWCYIRSNQAMAAAMGWATTDAAGEAAATGAHATVAAPRPNLTSLTDAQRDAAIDAIDGHNPAAASRTSANTGNDDAVAQIAGSFPTSGPESNCVALSQSACTALLTADGFTATPTYTPLSFSGADVTKPAGAIVTQSVAAGVTTSFGAAQTFSVNPANADMPMEVFRPLVGETYLDYLARLAAAGYVGTITYVDLTDSTGDPELGPDAVPKISVKLATATAPTVLSLRAWPSTHPKIRRGADVEVFRNPHDFPPVDPEAPPADPTNPGDPPLVPPGSGGTCSCPSLDLTPFQAITVGTSFPFGAFNWFKDAMGTPSPSALAFTLSLPDPVGSFPVDTSNSWWEANRGTYYPIMEFLITVAFFFVFATRILGMGKADED
jgi:hypothetical protein